MKVVKVLPETVSFLYSDITAFGKAPERAIYGVVLHGTGYLEDEWTTCSVDVHLTNEEYRTIMEAVSSVCSRVVGSDPVGELRREYRV
jgi:hypothetical protein